MMRLNRAVLALLVFLLPCAAFAQCAGQAPSNSYCGNISGAQALPKFNPLATIPFPIITSIAQLKAVDTTAVKHVFLVLGGRSGDFIWTTGDYTAAIAADTNNGVYVKANAIAASSGAWIRNFDFTNYQAKWFGAVADYSTDNTAIISNMIAVANAQNTLSGVAQQTGVYLNIEGGVKFASRNVSWLPSAGWIFVRLRYWANSDTTQGVSTGGGGTNEYRELSVNSGYPADVTGALVEEKFTGSPLHPSLGVNLQKNIDNSIFVHSGATQSIQPNATLNAATASVAFIRDENLDRFRIGYTRFAANDNNNGIDFVFYNRSTELVCSGCNGAGAWGANIPAVGSVVRGLTSLSRYVITSMAVLDIINTDWISGTAVPGEFLMSERAIFKGSISGNTLTVTSMLQGGGNIAVGQRVVGMYANNGVAVSTNITGLGTGAGGVGTYTVNNSQTIAATELVSGYVAANNVAGGGVVDTDTQSIPMTIRINGQLYTNNAAFLNRSAVSYANGAAAQTGTLTNAPVSGNPTKWIAIDDNGTTRYIPTW